MARRRGDAASTLQSVSRRWSNALALAFSVVVASWIGSSDVAGSAPPAPRALSETIVLTCADSVGQQGRHGEYVVGGVEGLRLKSSSSAASLTRVQGARGKTYYVIKDFLAVSASAAPYATVTIVRPATARLFYGPPVTAATMLKVSKRAVRLPVCGPDFTGYVGGIVVTRPTTVTFAVRSPHGVTRLVTAPFGTK